MAQHLIESVYSTRPGTEATHLDWLKTPPKRHGPGTLVDTLDKVRFLKSLGAHEWDLADVALAKQQAYARQVQTRRPVKTREIKASRQTIELVCFLRATLLELTDIALQQSSRRSQQEGDQDAPFKFGSDLLGEHRSVCWSFRIASQHGLENP